MIKEGDKMPDVRVKHMDHKGPVDVSLPDLCKGKKVVIFGVPGAYTPTCSLKHLPGYVEHAEEMFSKNVDVIACISVNDVFVMDSWGKDTEVKNKVMMLSDGNAEFAERTGLEMDGNAFGMGKRLQRFALIAEDGVITLLHIEKPGAFEVSSAEAVLAKL
ncbi:MAG: peroxiredoxin [Gammaproteobacteria bacterium]